jgi:hypothetical protein
MKRKAWFLALFWVCCSVWAARGAVRFDGLQWYHSEDSSRLVVNEEGELVWVKPRAPDQVTVKLPAMDVSNVGDARELQPKKIDALGMYFPNPKAYSSIRLAGRYFSCRGGGK